MGTQDRDTGTRTSLNWKCAGCGRILPGSEVHNWDTVAHPGYAPPDERLFHMRERVEMVDGRPYPYEDHCGPVRALADMDAADGKESGTADLPVTAISIEGFRGIRGAMLGNLRRVTLLGPAVGCRSTVLEALRIATCRRTGAVTAGILLDRGETIADELDVATLFHDPRHAGRENTGWPDPVRLRTRGRWGTREIEISGHLVERRPRRHEPQMATIRVDKVVKCHLRASPEAGRRPEDLDWLHTPRPAGVEPGIEADTNVTWKGAGRNPAGPNAAFASRARRGHGRELIRSALRKARPGMTSVTSDGNGSKRRIGMEESGNIALGALGRRCSMLFDQAAAIEAAGRGGLCLLDDIETGLQPEDGAEWLTDAAEWCCSHDVQLIATSGCNAFLKAVEDRITKVGRRIGALDGVVTRF